MKKKNKIQNLSEKSYHRRIDGVDYYHIEEDSHYNAGYVFGKLLTCTKKKAMFLLRNWLTRSVFEFACWATKKKSKRLIVPLEYIEELKGYAAATRMPFRYVFFLNYYFDVIPRLFTHCTTISVFKNKNKKLVGRNTDLVPYQARLAAIFDMTLVATMKIKGKAKYTHMSFPYFAGAITGFNEHGLAVHSHLLNHINDWHKMKRTATPVAMRLMLEHAKTIKEAEKIMHDNLPFRSLNIMVTKDTAVKYEIHPNAVHKIPAKGKTHCCTTHFETPELFNYHQKDVTYTVRRLASAKKLVNEKVGFKEMVRILKDTSNGMDVKTTGQSISNNGTYQSSIIDLSNLKIYVCNGRRIPVTHHGKYVEIKQS